MMIARVLIALVALIHLYILTLEMFLWRTRARRIFGMSAEQAEQCIANKAEDERINKVSLEAQQKYNLTGTPTFVVDGIPQSSGAVPYEQLAKVLDAALAKKK